MRKRGTVASRWYGNGTREKDVCLWDWIWKSLETFLTVILQCLNLVHYLKQLLLGFFSPGSFGNGENGEWEYDECLISGNSEDQSKRSAWWWQGYQVGIQASLTSHSRQVKIKLIIFVFVSFSHKGTSSCLNLLICFNWVQVSYMCLYYEFCLLKNNVLGIFKSYFSNILSFPLFFACSFIKEDTSDKMDGKNLLF